MRDNPVCISLVRCFVYGMVIALLVVKPLSLYGYGLFDPNPHEFLHGHHIVEMAAGRVASGDGGTLAVALSGEARRVLVFNQTKQDYPDSADYIIEFDALPYGLLLGDFYQDNRVDLAVTTRNRLLLFRGSPKFSEHESGAQVFHNVNQGSRRGLHAARLYSGTPRLDFVVGPVVRRWDGGQRVRDVYVFGPESNNNGRVALADLNLDGVVDAVFEVTDEEKLRIYYGPFPERQIRPSLVREFVELKAPQSGLEPFIADMDDDGRLDIVAVGRDPGDNLFGVYVWLQNSPLGFSDGAEPDFVIRGRPVPLAVQLADINGDGLTDIIALERGRRGSRLLIFLQNRERSWPDDVDGADQVISLPTPARRLWVLDFFGNGLLDIAVAASQPDQLLIYRNVTSSEDSR